MLLQALTLLISSSMALALCPSGLETCECRERSSTSISFYCRNRTASEATLRHDLEVINNQKFSAESHISLSVENDVIRYIGAKYFLDTVFSYISLTVRRVTGLDDSALIEQRNSLENFDVRNTELMMEFPYKAINVLQKLKFLDVLGNVGITILKKDTFTNQKNPESITEVNVGACSIYTIEEGTFTPLVNLKKLYLYTNELSSFSASCLPSRFPHLEKLDLSHNTLEGLPVGVLKLMPTNSHVALDYNKITNINEEDMKVVLDATMVNHVTLRLQNNNLNCSCSFKQLATLGDVNPVNWYGSCSYPSTLKRKYLQDLTVKDFSNC